jgi:phage replication-related protein YjqB (UPF0714/DUF867 family)
VNPNLTAENDLVQARLAEFSKTLSAEQAFDLAGYMGSVLKNASMIVDGIGLESLASVLKLYGFTLMHIAAAQTKVAGGPFDNDCARQKDLHNLIMEISKDLDTAITTAAGGAQ